MKTPECADRKNRQGGSDKNKVNNSWRGNKWERTMVGKKINSLANIKPSSLMWFEKSKASGGGAVYLERAYDKKPMAIFPQIDSVCENFSRFSSYVGEIGEKLFRRPILLNLFVSFGRASWQSSRCRELFSQKKILNNHGVFIFWRNLFLGVDLYWMGEGGNALVKDSATSVIISRCLKKTQHLKCECGW